MRKTDNFGVRLFLCVLMIMTFGISNQTATIANNDLIRVALYVDNGNAYRNTVPTVTLKSTEPLQIGTIATSASWWQSAANESVAFTLDRYHIQMIQTTSFSEAEIVASALKPLVSSPYIHRIPSGDHVIYEVGFGDYENSEEAERVRSALVNNPLRPQVLATMPGVIRAPLYLSTGTYEQRITALERQAVLRAVGFEAELVVKHNNGATSYSIWIGGAATLTGLKIQEQLFVEKFPEIQLWPVSIDDTYIRVRQAAEDAAWHLFPSKNQTTTIKTNQERIVVKERSNRIYRGTFELALHKGKMALINLVPMDEYLYSVVGAEMGAVFPLEALKAQAVMARTYVLNQGNKYQIAHVSDTTFDQAYYGTDRESLIVIQAVQETTGEVLVNGNGNRLHTYYSSNAGGMTADGLEVWGNTVAGSLVTASPDQLPEQFAPEWYQVILPDGRVGFVLGSYTDLTNMKSKNGLPIVKPNVTNLNVRPAPEVNNSLYPAIAQVNPEDELLMLRIVRQNNSYSWTAGPFAGPELLGRMNVALSTNIVGSITQLSVTQRGKSGRIMQIIANGDQVVQVPHPDRYRTVFGGLRSTKFEIEETATMHVLGANGEQTVRTNGSIHAISGTGQQAEMKLDPFIMNLQGEWRSATLIPAFKFIGYGFGHGLGMSQWGARGLAEQGKNYREILAHYYQGGRVSS